MSTHQYRHHHARDHLVRPHSHHRNSSTDTNTQGLPPIKRTPRACTMSTIVEKQHPSCNSMMAPSPRANHRNKKRHSSSSSNSISTLNLTEDDMPLALLAYKKGYAHLPPQMNQAVVVHRNRNRLSDGSSKTTTPDKRKKPHVPYQIKTSTESSTSQSSTVVATPTTEYQKPTEKKIPLKKKWFSSLYKLLSMSKK